LGKFSFGECGEGQNFFLFFLIYSQQTRVEEGHEERKQCFSEKKKKAKHNRKGNEKEKQKIFQQGDADNRNVVRRGKFCQMTCKL